MKKYSTILQFKDSIPICLETKEPESYFQAIELHRKKLEISISCKVRLIENLKFEEKGSDDDDEEWTEINGYRVGDQIGNGQFGVVYKGYSQNRVVAVKRMYKKPLNLPFSMTQLMKASKRYGKVSSDFLIMEMNMNRIRWECFVTSRLNHDNVVHLLECIDSPFSNQICFIQPLASLGELKWLRSRKDEVLEQWKIFMQDKLLTVEEFALRVFEDISCGLNYLHLQGIIHRDIKPQNILVDPVNKSLRIADFGCSVIIPDKLPFVIQHPQAQHFFTEELNKIVGTPAFIAPELCDFSDTRSKLHPVNASKIDIWSMGISLYLILNNELPFLGEHEFETYNQIVHKELHVPSNTDENKWINTYVINTILSKNPSTRSSAAECLTDLQQYLKKRSSTSTKIRQKLTKLKTCLKKPKKEANFHPKASTELPTHLDHPEFNLSHSPQKVLPGYLQTDQFPKKQTIMRSHRATIDLEKYIK